MAKGKWTEEKKKAWSVKCKQTGCNNLYKINRFPAMGLLTKDLLFSKSKNWQGARSEIRRHAEFIFESDSREKCCNKCGYDKHVEICHIKSVSSFSGDSLLGEINHKSNLMGLCPNCHWEFDNGLWNINKLAK